MAEEASRRPHRCPNCEGTGKKGGADCVSCGGDGVVWSPASAEEGAEASPLDLQYQPE